jgi:hypothetical protein
MLKKKQVMELYNLELDDQPVFAFVLSVQKRLYKNLLLMQQYFYVFN